MKALVIFILILPIISFCFILETIPGGVDVYLDGDYIGNTGEDGKFVIDAVSGTLKLTKPGYWTVSFPLTGDGTTIKMFLSVHGRVNTDPEGARLYVDGFYLGKSPYEGELPFGEHILKAILDDFGEVTSTVHFTFSGDNLVNLKIHPYGTVLIETDIDAKLEIDGEDLGQTPVKVILKPGRHILKFHVDGELVLETEVMVSERQPFKILKFDLPRVYTVVVDTIPEGAKVKIDGKFGVSPFVSKLKEGVHKIAISKEGYEKIEETVNIPEDGTTFIFSLKRITFDLTVESTPVSTVYVDGVELGTTPLETRMPFGEHRVYLVEDRGKKWFDILYLDGPAKLDVDMNRRGTLIILGKSPVRVNDVLFIPPTVIHPLVGFHDILIETDSSTITFVLEIKPGDVKVISDEPNSGALVIEAEDDVQVLVNGNSVKPGELMLVKEGDSVIELRKDGDVFRDVLRIPAGKLVIYKKGMLTFKKMVVEIVTNPAGCEVEIDGKHRGESPLKVILIPGYHRFVFTCMDKRFEKFVKVEDEKIEFDLEVDKR